MFTAPSVKNVKIHFKIRAEAIPTLIRGLLKNRISSHLVRHGNLIVLKYKFVFIIFETSGFINATGIKSLEEIRKCLKVFRIILNIRKRDIRNITVDNITASGNFDQQLNLYKIRQKIHANHNLQKSVLANYNRDIFPGLFLKYKKIGTIILFSSGKYSIVGIKCRANMYKIFQETNVLINQL